MGVRIEKQMNETFCIKDRENEQFIYFKVWWFQREKTFEGYMVLKHEHECVYDKTEPILIKRFQRCTCTFHSLWGVNQDKWCRVIKKSALWMCEMGLLDKIVREWILG